MNWRVLFNSLPKLPEPARPEPTSEVAPPPAEGPAPPTLADVLRGPKWRAIKAFIASEEEAAARVRRIERARAERAREHREALPAPDPDDAV